MEDTKAESEVRLYRTPFGLRQRFVTRRTMFVRLFLYAASLALAFFLGVLWGSYQTPSVSRLSDDEVAEKQAVRRCCLNEVRTAQEALTKLSVDSQKLRLRLTGGGKNAGSTDIASTVRLLEERSRVVWDQLESLLQEPNDSRRKLRDIRINIEALKEHFKEAEICCGRAPETMPTLKHYLQTVELRFQVVQAKVSPAYIEGELNIADVAHESGYSYVLKHDFDIESDTTSAPKASNLKVYEDGMPLGPSHAQHGDIREWGQGRYSHWGDSLYFSSSDNTDPRTNKRRYTYRAYSTAPPDPQTASPSTPTTIK